MSPWLKLSLFINARLFTKLLHKQHSREAQRILDAREGISEYKKRIKDRVRIRTGLFSLAMQTCGTLIK